MIKKVKKVFNEEMLNQMKKTFYAFDVETTGLNPNSDRIIEIGCVKFENLVPVKEFKTLVNANKFIPHHVTEVNNITNLMLLTAPREKKVYQFLCEFIRDVLDGKSIIVAHNARFDMSFLANTLERLNYSGTLNYLDTLEISKNLLKGLPNYKQITVASYLNIPITNAHRASDDALVCGKILAKLISRIIEITEKVEKRGN